MYSSCLNVTLMIIQEWVYQEKALNPELEYVGNLKGACYDSSNLFSWHLSVAMIHTH